MDYQPASPNHKNHKNHKNQSSDKKITAVFAVIFGKRLIPPLPLQKSIWEKK
jgi:hypothetical protein